MFDKIKKFFKSDFLKKFLKFVICCFCWLIFISFVFAFLVNCVYFGIKLAEIVPISNDLLDVFSSLIFS